MDAENERIWRLFGALSDAAWRQGADPGGNVSGKLWENLVEYQPVSAEERAVWAELTSPHNYTSLCRYFESRKREGCDLYADTFHAPVLSAATRRWNEVTANTGQPQRPPSADQPAADGLA
jgi:hypothetical protein